MTRVWLLVFGLAIAGVGVSGAHAAERVARAAATCSDYSTQAQAQRAADTQDSDDDGIYCETLPCPCSDSGGNVTPTPAPKPKTTDCTRPKAVQRLSFSKTRHRHIRRHYIAAVGRGWPRILVLNRPYASARRARLLEGYEIRGGFDRDEYPPAVGRGRGKGLVRGSHPRGWKADVDYIVSSENRSQGTRLGIKLRRFCNGTRFRYSFY